MAVEPVKLLQITNINNAMKREVPAAVAKIAAYLKTSLKERF